VSRVKLYVRAIMQGQAPWFRRSQTRGRAGARLSRHGKEAFKAVDHSAT